MRAVRQIDPPPVDDPGDTLLISQSSGRRQPGIGEARSFPDRRLSVQQLFDPHRMLVPQFRLKQLDPGGRREVGSPSPSPSPSTR